MAWMAGTAGWVANAPLRMHQGLELAKVLVTLESGSDLDDDDARERRGDALVVLENEVLDAP